MEYVETDELRLCAEQLGDRDDPALLLISGGGSQLTNWPLGLCEAFVDRGFRVIRFDNRDVGLSTILDDGATYTLSDMAHDAVLVLAHFDAAPAHVFGISMGGMIAQVLAAEHPDALASLVSYASATGNPEFGWFDHDSVQLSATTRDDVIEEALVGKRLWGTEGGWDEAEFTEFIGSNFDRSHHPVGANRQIEAIAASGNRDDQVRTISAPTLVLHGGRDPLITPSAGRHTAELIEGAEYIELEGIGHDVPQPEWPQFVQLVTAHVARAWGATNR